jgi:hypothetical protein
VSEPRREQQDDGAGADLPPPEAAPAAGVGDGFAQAGVAPEAQWRIVAYQVSGAPLQLRKGEPRRAWMDGTPARFAYRCLPLLIANQLGWDVLCPATFTATWSGGRDRSDIRVDWAEGHWTELVSSHFGSGILTFALSFLFRTPPGVALLVSGPPNAPKPGAQALWGLVETDWSPATFTMNWQMTRPGEPVRFEAGEPFCRLIPLDVQLLERLEPQIRDIADEPELERLHRDWSRRRKEHIRDSRVRLSEAAEQGWQRDYFLASNVSWPAPRQHRTQLQHRELEDLRSDPPPRAGRQRRRPADTGPGTAAAGSVPAVEAGTARPDYSVRMAKLLLQDLSLEQRLEVLHGFCGRCGREDPHCGCPQRD